MLLFRERARQHYIISYSQPVTPAMLVKKKAGPAAGPAFILLFE
jgi:hypothetical protein